MHSSQLISDLDVLGPLHGLPPATWATPVIVHRGDGGIVGSEPAADSAGHRQTLVGLGDYFDDAFVDAIRAAALLSECDEDERPTMPTPIPAFTAPRMPRVVEVEEPPLSEAPLSELTPSPRRHVVLLDGVHDFLAATYQQEAERIIELSPFESERRSLRQRLQGAVEWLTRRCTVAWTTVFE